MLSTPSSKRTAFVAVFHSCSCPDAAHCSKASYVWNTSVNFPSTVSQVISPSQSIDGGLEATGDSLGTMVSTMGVLVGSSETLVGSSRSWHAHKHSANISNGHSNRRIICCPLCRYESNFVRYAYATISRFRCSPPVPLVRISYIDLLDIPKIPGLSVESYIIPFPA